MFIIKLTRFIEHLIYRSNTKFESIRFSWLQIAPWAEVGKPQTPAKTQVRTQRLSENGSWRPRSRPSSRPRPKTFHHKTFKESKKKVLKTHCQVSKTVVAWGVKRIFTTVLSMCPALSMRRLARCWTIISRSLGSRHNGGRILVSKWN